MDLATEVAELRREIAELTRLITNMVSPATSLSIAEKSRLIREAHASGNKATIRKTTKLINSKGSRL